MADLLSIAPLTETVDVRGAEAIVKGVPVKAIAGLLARFPPLRKMWASGQWDAEQLLSMSDDVIGAVIAAGVNIDEENAANLALDEKAELLAAIIRITMPRGPGPFMATLTALLGTVGGAKASPTAPASKSRTQSSN